MLLSMNTLLKGDLNDKTGLLTLAWLQRKETVHKIKNNYATLHC